MVRENNESGWYGKWNHRGSGYESATTGPADMCLDVGVIFTSITW